MTDCKSKASSPILCPSFALKSGTIALVNADIPFRKKPNLAKSAVLAMKVQTK
jgi:hypothetical protein